MMNGVVFIDCVSVWICLVILVFICVVIELLWWFGSMGCGVLLFRLVVVGWFDINVCYWFSIVLVFGFVMIVVLLLMNLV